MGTMFHRLAFVSVRPAAGIGRAALILGALLLAPSARGADGAPTAPAGAPAPEAGGVAANVAPFAFPADDRELLALDDEMRGFFAARVDADATENTRLNQVITALLGDQGLHLLYVTDANYPARETFRRRQGNCLSFSFLAVAVARAYGLKAKFCEVNTYPRWDRYGKLITEIRHLNVAIWADGIRYELDLLPVAERQAPVESAKIVSDPRAFAHFYNNLGVFRLALVGVTEAQRLFDRALAADATAAFVWANKGAALRLAGEFQSAQDCLDQAMREDPRDPATLTNLASLYTQTGRFKEAAALNKKVERYREQNPYYLSLLARAEIDRGHLREADKLLRRAIGIKNDEPEFFELRIQVAQSLGWTKDARRWADKLRELQNRSAPAARTPSIPSAQGAAGPSPQAPPESGLRLNWMHAGGGDGQRR